VELLMTDLRHSYKLHANVDAENWLHPVLVISTDTSNEQMAFGLKNGE
jgi:hypothetical protein